MAVRLRAGGPAVATRVERLDAWPVRIMLGLVAGLSAAVAFEPLAIAYLAPIALAVLLVAIEGLTWRRAPAVAGVFGLGFMSVLLFWLVASVGLLAWVALSAVQACWFAALGVMLSVVRHLPFWPVWAAVLWVALEVVRSAWPFGGLPWGRFGFAVIDTPWADGLSLVGVSGMSLFIALLGSCLAWLVLNNTRPTALRLVVLLGLAALLTSLAVLGATPEPIGSVRVAVVQGDVPGAGNDLVAHHRQVTRNHVDATVVLADEVAVGSVDRPDLVIWPENSTAVDPFRDPEANAALRRASTAIGAPILFGGIVDGPTTRTARNQGLVWEGGEVTDRYTKQHLVPFGEYIPWRPILGGVSDRLEAIKRDMLPGGQARPLSVAGVQIADSMCFDIAYDDVLGPQVRRGAELAVVQTSNAMFVGTAQPEQQFAISRARALETGRSVVVSSVNGISGVIAADGSSRHRLEPRTTAVLSVEVPLHRQVTMAVRLGSWPNRLVLLAAGIALGWALGRRLLARPTRGSSTAGVYCDIIVT